MKVPLLLFAQVLQNHRCLLFFHAHQADPCPPETRAHSINITRTYSIQFYFSFFPNLAAAMTYCIPSYTVRRQI